MVYIYMTSINNYLYEEQFGCSIENIHNPAIKGLIPVQKINIDYIIENKPPTKIVREYMKKNLESIKSEEQELFEI